MNGRLKKLLRTIIFFSTGIIILYLVYVKQNQAYLEECALRGIAEADCSLIRKIYQDFLSARIWVLLLVLVLFMISNISRAMRWMMLLKPLGIDAKPSNAFYSVMLGYFANLGLPRVGEIIRAATLARYEKAKLDKVMGTVIVDRVMDVICMLGVMLIALVSSYRNMIGFIKENNAISEKLNGFLSNPFLIGAGILLLILLLVFIRSPRIKRSTIGVKIHNFFIGMADGLKSIASLEKPWLFVFHSVFIWLMYYLMMYVGFSAFAPTAHIGPIAGLFVFMLGGLGIIIPSPGGMGTYHFLVTAGLQMYGVTGADGFSFANILFFTIQIFGNVFFGILALIMLPLINNS